MATDETPEEHENPPRRKTKFEGSEVKNRELKVSGSIALALGIEDPHKLGDQIVFLGTAVVNKIGHEAKGKGQILTRMEDAGVIDLFVVTDSTDALDMLQRARAEREQALDDLLGRQKLPLEDDKATVSEEAAQFLADQDANPRPEGLTDEQWEDMKFEQGLKDVLDEKPDDDPGPTEGDSE